MRAFAPELPSQRRADAGRGARDQYNLPVELGPLGICHGKTILAKKVVKEYYNILSNCRYPYYWLLNHSVMVLSEALRLYRSTLGSDRR
jgi:hypothetical protein